MDATQASAQYLQLAKEWLINNGIGALMAIAIFICGRWLAHWLANLGQKALLKGGVDETLVHFLNKLIYYALLTAVLIAAADQLGIKTTSFIAILGAAGLAIGLALKDSLANFASGVMLILFRPFKVGDVVTAAGVTGAVRNIDIFSTVILTGDNQKIIVPNSSITSNIITNINAEPLRRIDLSIGIGYRDDIGQAKDTLYEILRAEPRILADPPPVVAVAELAASSVQLVVRPWVQRSDYWDVRFDLTETIKLTFDDRGISFPYPQQDIHLFQMEQPGDTGH
ncbi:MAG: mechanosensitive ion channel domain-containing protein [Pseudomonadota bacterium]